MAGKLYGIGVGPGDPELLTLKAKRLLERSQIIAYPVRSPGGGSTALDIIRSVIDPSDKCIVELLFRMDPDDRIREVCRADAICRVVSLLDEGKDIAMITLGDVAVYSTYMHIDQEIGSLGYDTEIVPGIPSFCSGAALAKLPLVTGNEGLAVVSMAKDNKVIGRALDGFDNIVVMKAFNSMGRLVRMMEERGIDVSKGTVVSCIGLQDEYIGPMDVDRDYGYFTTVIIKKNGWRDEERYHS